MINNEWLPIESAPRYETIMLYSSSFDKRSKGVFIAMLDEDGYSSPYLPAIWSHWQPIPDAPG